jgi:DinB superfamily
LAALAARGRTLHSDAAHRARIGQLRAAFAEANERLVARLRAADEAAAERVPAAGGWSPAQIGWHVARVTTQFAGVMSGDRPGAKPVDAGFAERPWAEIAPTIADRLEAPAAFQPPPAVSRRDAIAALEASGVAMARALDAVTAERGAGFCLTSPVVGGAISLYQVSEWATAHVIRHNKQAKQILGV